MLTIPASLFGVDLKNMHLFILIFISLGKSEQILIYNDGLLGNSGLTALLRSRTAEYYYKNYLVSSRIQSSNLSVTGPTL